MDPSRDAKNGFLNVALDAVRKAETFVKIESVKGFTTTTKDDGSFVTTVDTGVEKLLVDELGKAFPDHDITGEELGGSDLDSDYRWYIDPIDGTLSFKLGLPYYGIILSLCYRGRPIVCVLSHPALGMTYHAVRGGGAFRNGDAIAIEDVAPKQVANEMIATGDRYAFRLSNALGRYDRLLKRHPLVRTIPDCLGHTLAAQGSVGAMVDYYLNYWDLAATELLVAEAGGKFVITGTQTRGNAGESYNMICGKPSVVDWLIEEIFG